MNGLKLIHREAKLVAFNDGTLWAETHRGTVIGVALLGVRRSREYYKYAYEGSFSDTRFFSYPYLMKEDSR